MLSFPAVCVGAVGFPVSAADENIVAFDSFVTFPKPTLVAVVPLRIVEVESWLDVAPNAAPAVTVATATLFIVPVKLPPKIVALLSFATLPKPTSPFVVPCALSEGYVPSASNSSPVIGEVLVIVKSYGSPSLPFEVSVQFISIPVPSTNFTSLFSVILTSVPSPSSIIKPSPISTVSVLVTVSVAVPIPVTCP